MRTSELISRLKFIILILTEPFPYFIKWLLRILKIKDPDSIYYGTRQRKPVEDGIVQVCVHEWGGYAPIRCKNVETVEFECGLKYQAERFKQYRKDGKVKLTITMSDSEKHQDIAWVKSNCDSLIEVSNIGMDFNGYRTFWETIKDKTNSYVILTNSSVEKYQCDFLEGYVKYMNDNPDVGMLGISYSTKMYHTLLRFNFTPHIESFFVLTTTDILSQVVQYNKGQFPGANADYKRLLIREGEHPLSLITAKLGYRLAVVYPDTGIPFKFTGRKEWTLPFNDLRLSCKFPNRIQPIADKSKIL